MYDETRSIGPLIKNMRTSKHLSLRALAAQTGLTASFLSQVENGKSQLSIQSLQLISDALDVPIHSLLFGTGNDQEEELKSKEPEIFHVESQHSPSIFLPDRGVISELRTPNMGQDLEVLFSTGHRSSGNTAKQLNVDKKEVIFIIEGTVKVVIGDNEYLLEPQDSIYFAHTELQEFSCVTEEAKWLSIISH